MKLRQKLAMVLASAMVVTAVPVITMAKSTNEMNKVVSIVEGTILNATKGVALDMKFDANQTTQDTTTTFFLKTEDFEFDKDAYTTANQTTGVYVDATTGLKVEILSKTEAKVTVPVKVAGNKVSIPVYGKVLKGNPAIVVDGEDSLATSGKYSLATGEVVTDKTLTVKAGTVKNISIDGEGQIADIIIEEKVAGGLQNDAIITVSLPNSSDLNFKEDATLEVEELRGLAGQDIKVVDAKLDDDAKTLELKVSGITSSVSRGGIKIKGIQVEAENAKYDVKTGEVKVTVKAEKMDETKLVVANVTDFGVKLNVKEEVEVVAGKDGKTVQVTLEENAIASLNQRQDIYFDIEGATITSKDIEIVEGKEGVVTAELDAKKENVIGLVLDTAKIDPAKANKIVFEFEVEGKVADAGDITLTASSRSFEKDIQIKLGTVKEAVKVEAAPMTVKVGLTDQKGGKVVITETEAEMLPRGKEIVVEVAKGSKAGITVTDAKVEAEDIQIKNVKVKDGKIFFTIDRTSDELGKITISDITVDTDRTVPEGKFDLTVGGDAISKHKDDVITVEDFFVVGTPNTEDNTTNGLKKGTGIFKVGERKYTVNGEVKEMDAAPYVAKSNRVMVPVKYVSDVFGVNGKDVLFSKENGGTITIFAGNRVLQVVNGSNIALVNGVKVPMDEKVTIIDGRTYVPVGEMARLLNVEVEWSNETKTATFTNR